MQEFKESTLDALRRAEEEASPIFKGIDNIAFHNQLKVLNALKKHRVSYSHFAESSGYGYDDIGRDTLDSVYAEAFEVEDALVRVGIMSGTHALTLCMFGILRPGDTLLSVCGKPYDTLEEVIGIRGGGCGSLQDFGINYKQVNLTEELEIDYKGIETAIMQDNSIKAVLVQRSKGYEWRRSISVDEIDRIVKTVKLASSNRPVMCIVDNCYGEFVEKREPNTADLIVGSLIKNPGGGLAISGGYIAGKADLIEKVSYRYTAPGLGKHIGASLGFNKLLYQGLFLAPNVVAESLKAAVLSAVLFKRAGFDVCPEFDEKRTDIIQAIKLNSEENLIKFCQCIQANSPVDSFVKPEPWDMPGYEHDVIMAAGTFTQGASIELSADAPLKSPYIVYQQGGLTYNSAKAAVAKSYEILNCT